ncbi:MAG TPA: 5'/3'-nucleotidase SurE [Myxococcota bacterium]|nr:5'/3'-nucleotidase SurE [Myxococcota bacterium]
MRILLANDDGFYARGLPPLAEVLSELGEVWVVAPEREQSARSHALTMHKPLRATEQRPRWFSVSGTPADSVYLGIHHLMPQPPDVVVSGINRGANLGNDVLYSGTVAAAMEGALLGLPSLAISLYFQPGTPKDLLHFDTAAVVAKQVVEGVLAHGSEPRTVLNVNVPDRAWDDLRGIVPARLGIREYEPLVDAREDPRGRPYYWIGGTHSSFAPIQGSDGPLCQQGYATVTPLSADLTHSGALADLAWLR